MRSTRLIAQSVIVEAVRKREFWVILLAAAGLVLGVSAVRFFGLEGLSKVYREAGLTLINALTLVVAVVFAAKQMPTELKTRTLHPMLAKRVTRWQIVVGKFLGSFLAVFTAYLALMAVYLLLNWRIGAAIHWEILFQGMYLRALSIALVVAMAIFLSLVATHSAAVTIGLLVVLMGEMISRAIVIVHAKVPEAGQWAIGVVHWMVPHLDLFDLSSKIIHEWSPVALWAIGALTVYAAAFTTVLLGGGWLAFRRRIV